MNRHGLTKMFRPILSGFTRWIDAVAGFVASTWQFATPRTIKIVETDNGEFIVCDTPQPDSDLAAERIRIADGQGANGVPQPIGVTLRASRVELTLKPDRFLFRPLELPQRATEFLDGIIRAQIDRLTPWTAAEAAFGWSRTSPAGNDRIIVTVAATARALLAPYLQTLTEYGAQSIAVFTTPPGQAAADPIKVAEEQAAGSLDIGRIRQILSVTLVAAAIAAAGAVAGSAFVSINLDTQNDQLTQQIATFRAAAKNSRELAAGSLAAAQHTVEVRKHTRPSSVMIVEALSQILPDDTYATELRIEDNKIQLVGVTHNAPALIGLIERSGLFARATFFAPTTRSSTEAGERFHIEALIQPLGAPRS